MASVERGSGFPVPAVILGAIGAPLLAFGVMGLFAPAATEFLPMLREPTIATAFLAVGAVLTAIELVMVLSWLRRRQTK